MGLDLSKLVELGNLPGKAVEAGVETVKTGAQSVKDWRDTNTDRKQNSYRHEEKMYENSTSRLLGIIGSTINAINQLSLSYGKIKEAHNHETQINNDANKNRMKHDEEMEKITIRLTEVRGDLERMQKESDTNLENKRITIRASIDWVQNEYNRYMSLSDEYYFSPEVQRWLKDLREVIIRLTEMTLNAGDTK